MRERKFTAPQLEYFVSSSRHCINRNPKACTPATAEALEELFVEVRKLSPVFENGGRTIYCLVDRGPIEDWADYEDYLADEIVTNYAEFEEAWKRNYPYEKQWFEFSFLDDDSNGYKGVWVNNQLTINTMPNPFMNNDIIDEPEFVKWLTEKVRECIKDIKAGTYNRKVREELAFELRTGTIIRNDLWEVFPEDKAEYFSDITDADCEEFIKLMADYEEDAVPENLITDMTSGLFYECCKAGYIANDYEGSSTLSGKELYLKHADGRDEGLQDIAMDSPEAFRQWLKSRNQSGHPWEVCRGGNSTHVSLFVSKTENGFYFTVDGKSWARSIESIKFYLALHRLGMPVKINKGKRLAERLLGKNKVGIVPEGVFPRYCESLFPGEEILDFINLPYENREQLAAKCNWYAIPEVTLLAEDTGGRNENSADK